MPAAALLLYRALFGLALPVAVPWLLWRNRRRGRPPLRVRERLGLDLPPVRPGGVWVQAVSVGEVAVARLLLKELRRRHPLLPAVLTSTTVTGLRLAAGPQLADVILPFPLDLPGPVRRMADHIAPRLLVLVETELWPELLAACGRRGVAVAIANARISDSSLPRYRAVRPLMRPLLAPVTLVLAQGEVEAERFAALGIAPQRIHITGNIKFDAAPLGPPPAVAGQIRRLAGARRVLVAGSTMAGEEELVLDAWLAVETSRRPFLLLAPRHPERAGEVAALLQARRVAAARRSMLDGVQGPLDAVVLDTVGELAALYELGCVAFVGGSLVPTGGHNPIEPARFGVPVLTGPYVRNFASVYHHFFAAGAARLVRGATDLRHQLERWLANPGEAQQAGAAGRALLARHAGATARTVDALEPLLGLPC
jgi:3-deoxy-D-manno-octulosonic-acid transferase